MVCSREKSDYFWYLQSWEYFSCPSTQKCCGNAWNRYCCEKSGTDPDFIALYLMSGLMIVVLMCLLFSFYLLKNRRHSHYLKFHEWWSNAVARGQVLKIQTLTVFSDKNIHYFWFFSKRKKHFSLKGRI